jgi:hypothetical protein
METAVPFMLDPDLEQRKMDKSATCSTVTNSWLGGRPPYAMDPDAQFL